MALNKRYYPPKSTKKFYKETKKEIKDYEQSHPEEKVIEYEGD